MTRSALVKPDRIILPSVGSTPEPLLLNLGFTKAAAHFSIDDGFSTAHYKLL